MSGRTLAAVAAGILIVLVCCAGAVGLLTTSTGIFGLLTAADAGHDPANAADCAPPAVVTGTAGGYPRIGRWNPTQVGNAAVIIQTGATLRVPVRGRVIAVATAMQESSLHNYPNLGARNDHDSLGLFQQRPSQGWGTPAQILNPVHAATAFYRHLLAIRGWQNLPLTVAAQRVQRSAFPNAYAKWEPQADQLVTALTGADPAAGCDSPPTPDTRPTNETAAATTPTTPAATAVSASKPPAVRS
jgi:hypothetical protein